MINLAPTTLLAIWNELEDARIGVNGYGGNTAELYAYRFLPEHSSMFSNPNITPGGIFEEIRNEAAAKALNNLYEVLKLYKQMRNVSIKVNDRTFGAWLKKDQYFYHRCHVTINEIKRRR